MARTWKHHVLTLSVDDWIKKMSQVALVVKNPPASAGDGRDAGMIPRLRRSPGGGCSNPLQHSRLENPMDRGAWQATVHRVAESDRTEQLKKIKNSIHIYIPWVRAKSLQSCPTLCDPMDCSPPGSSVHRILQARMLEWVAIFFCRGSSSAIKREEIRLFLEMWVAFGQELVLQQLLGPLGCLADSVGGLLRWKAMENDS